MTIYNDPGPSEEELRLRSGTQKFGTIWIDAPRDRMDAFRAVSDEETRRIDDAVREGRMRSTWAEFFEVGWRGYARDWPALTFVLVVWIAIAVAGLETGDVRLFGFAIPFAVSWAFLLGWNSAD